MSISRKVSAACQAIIFGPVDYCIVVALRVLSKIRALIYPAYQYGPLDTLRNQVRMVRLHRALTSRDDEPVCCSINAVSLDAWKPEYESWSSLEGQNIPPRKRIVEWYTYVGRTAVGTRKNDPQRFARFSWGDYFAISYAWGSTESRDMIVLDGQAVEVPHSVTVALRSVRSLVSRASMGSNACFVWIDFLCINQSDAFDKGQQVMRMHDIYSQAYLNLIVLGESEDDSDLAMDLTVKVSVYSNKGFDYKQHLVDRWAEVNRGEKARMPDQKAFAAVSKLFARKYWGRMWIIQELAMADDISLVLCGDRITDLYSLRLMAKMYAENHEIVAEITKLEHPLFTFSDISPAMALLRWIGRLRQQVKIQEKSTNITYPELRSPLLSLAQSANVTYRYDKIFGMLALLPKDISAAMKPLLAELPTVIDHSPITQHDLAQSEREAIFITKVFTKFAVSIIQATNDLDVIFSHNTFQRLQSKLDLPSWVTDWTLKPDRSSHIPSHEWHFASEEGIYNQLIDEQQDNPLLPPQKWLASVNNRRSDGGKPGQISFSNDSRLLTCQGIMIGVVDGIAPEWGSGAETENSEMKWPEALRQPQCEQSPYGDERQTEQALLRTLLFDPLNDCKHESLIYKGNEVRKGDLDKEPRVVQHWDQKTWVGSFPKFESLRDRIGEFRLGSTPLKDFFPSGLEQFPANVLNGDILVLLSNFSNRRLVTTETGHIALAPSTVRPGDPIYIILGCSIPVILRASGSNGYHEVVGECYVEGFMKGECVAGAESGKRELQEIILC
ncbi:heterokaryon incompatibility protein-domain-containing protein [Phaeosphaeria sp. MPI-PUGE-AT-0046c]|nr:heterokaryon incompatibility protein-domain-containing protein [Phaeosphaeria sp. MPI-PUGE-AT-0046c]